MFARKLIQCNVYIGNVCKKFATATQTQAIPFTPVAKSKKKIGKMGAAVEKKVFPVEEDCQKLLKYVCGSNILKEGQDVEVKPDSEYPDWLWTLNTGKPPPLEEMDPESRAYWFRIRKMAIVQKKKLHKLRKW